jgi:hypothetical protein
VSPSARVAKSLHTRLEMQRRIACLIVTVLPALLAGQPSRAAQKSSDYLYLWTASADSTQPDFLAVMDARAGTPHGAVFSTP